MKTRNQALAQFDSLVGGVLSRLRKMTDEEQVTFAKHLLLDDLDCRRIARLISGGL